MKPQWKMKVCPWRGYSNTVKMENSLDAPHGKVGSLVLSFCWLFRKGALVKTGLHGMFKDRQRLFYAFQVSLAFICRRGHT